MWDSNQGNLDMKVIIEEDEAKGSGESDGLVKKAAKFAYNSVKNKLVSMLTGNDALSKLGTVIDILGFLRVIDKEKAHKKLASLSDFMKSGVDNLDKILAKVPLLEEMFGDEKETLNKILRFMIFAQQVSIGAYPAEKYNIARVVTVQSTLIAIIALNVITGGVLITGTWGIGLDLMCAAYNKVYKVVEPDIDEFEKWMKENSMDGAKLKKELEKGDVQKAAESSLKMLKWKRIY